MFVRVDRHGQAVLLHITLETVERGPGPFILIKPGKDPTAGIVDVGHQDTLRAAPLEPIMMGAIELHKFPHVSPPRPPGAVRPFASPKMRHASLPQPEPERLRAQRNPVPLR